MGESSPPTYPKGASRVARRWERYPVRGQTKAPSTGSNTRSSTRFRSALAALALATALAASAAGRAQSADRTLATTPVQAACPNEAIRAEQHAQGLPECRAYEMVSPPDKNGGEVPGDGVSVTAAGDGNAVAFTARGSFGDTVGAGPIGQTMYVARRDTGSGWQTHGVTPTPRWDALVSAGIPLVVDFSTDLRNAVVWAFDLPAVTGDLPTPNIYAEDTLTNDLSLVTQPLAGPQGLSAMARDFNRPNAVGVSDDSRHIAFTAAFSQLLPEAPAGVPSVYEWDNGTLRLASVLPGGATATSGAALASANPDVQETYRQTVSPDGSRLLFLSPFDREEGAPADAQLYERIDHSRTVWISEPEVGGTPPAPENVLLQQVTGDSRHVIFTTSSQLLPEDTNAGPDIYLYTEGPNPEHERNLTLITDSGNVSPQLDNGATAVIGSSDDGSTIYWFDSGQILAWHEGAITPVASINLAGAGAEMSLSATASAPGSARVSPDGRYLAFMAKSVVSNGPNPLIGDGAEHTELYLYDAVTDQLRCVSCPTAGAATSEASVIPSVNSIEPANFLLGDRPSFLASDGKVFFSTAQALVPQDVNGVADVYEFDPATGSVRLLSTGRGSEPAGFVGASRDGSDVFIVTRQRLVGADRDGFVDLYDVRVGGGFPEPPPGSPPCEGEACQGASPAPAAVSPTSARIGSRGNLHPRRHRKACRRKTKARRTRCGKHRHSRGRTAGPNRRNGK